MSFGHNRAQEIPTVVYTTYWHLVFSHCYLVMEERGSLQLILLSQLTQKMTTIHISLKGAVRNCICSSFPNFTQGVNGNTHPLCTIL